jgi:hypothetical protein
MTNEKLTSWGFKLKRLKKQKLKNKLSKKDKEVMSKYQVKL